MLDVRKLFRNTFILRIQTNIEFKKLEIKIMTKTFFKTAATSLLLSGMAVGMAQADTFNAALSMVEPISLTETTQMNLGTILANDTDTCTVAAAGARSGTGCFGSGAGTLAAIDVSGTSGLQVDIALTDGASAASELTFAPSILDNGTGATTLTGVTLQASHSLSLGGTVTVSNGALAVTNSVSSVDYQIDVTYQ